MDLKYIGKIAVDTAYEAGQIIKDGADRQKVLSTKSSEIDLLTEYDKAVDAFVSEKILAAFPDHQIMSEEGSEESRNRTVSKGDFVWHLDPIDGTINFVHGYPNFAVSMALYEGSHPLVAVVYDPTRDECFSAIAGQGAELRRAGSSQPLHVSKANKLVESLLATGFPYDRHHSSDDNLDQIEAYLKRVRGLRRSGSAAIDMAYVAAGRLDGFWELKLDSWDVAAGVLLINEAGGQVTHTDGQPIMLGSEISVMASNGHIHKAMLSVFDEVSSPPSG